MKKKKVLRVSDGRIFFSPTAVAIAYGRNIAKDVEYCCDHFIATVLGDKYEWYFEPENIVAERNKFIRTKRKELKSKYRSPTVEYSGLYKIINPIVKELREHLVMCPTLPAIIFSQMVINELVLKYGAWKSTPNGMTNHLHSHELAYRKLCGLHFWEYRNFRSHHTTWYISFDDELININAEVAVRIPGIGFRKVRSMNDGRIFDSIVSCSDSIGIEREMISMVCEGILQSCHYNNIDYEFEFVEE